jgi:rRNA maturation protein Nop10
VKCPDCGSDKVKEIGPRGLSPRDTYAKEVVKRFVRFRMATFQCDRGHKFQGKA